jgi:signal transduction histidine kinase
MSGTALRHSVQVAGRRFRPEHLWVAVVLANYVAALAWQSWEGLPFRVVWVGLAALYGLFVLRADRVLKVVFVLGALAGTAMLVDALHVVHLWNNPFDAPPVMAVMCLVLLWNARRHQEELLRAQGLSEDRGSLLERQERFIHDASHELRTPLTIARGHLELLRSRTGGGRDLDVALEELTRLDEIIGRLLLLAVAGQPDFLRVEEVDTYRLLEDVFVRWSEIAPRAWRLGPIPQGHIEIDPERIRTALDALLENAVKYTNESDPIELRARLERPDVLVIEVADQGIGVPAEALEQIFERFGRADPARGRSAGGVGLGLAIVDAIAKMHGGHCSVRSDSTGSLFALELPGFAPAAAPEVVPPQTVALPPSSSIPSPS